MNISVTDWLQAADHEVEMRRWRAESNGRTKHVVVEHELAGISPAAVAWYLINFDDETYRMWHPAHIALQWEKKVAGPGAIHVAWEKILGKLAAYRIRLDPPDLSPIAPHDPAGAYMLNIIDTEGEVLIYILLQTRSTSGGMGLTCTFIFPEAAPDEFVEAHRQHCVEEVPGMVNRAVSHLIEKTFGYAMEPERLAEYGLVVPAEAS